VDGLNPKDVEKRIKRLEEELNPEPKPPPPTISAQTQEAIQAIIEVRRANLWQPGAPKSRLCALLQERGISPEVAEAFAYHGEDGEGREEGA